MRTVLIAIDGSSQAEFAFTFYMNNLHQKENELVLAHCVEPLTIIGENPNVDVYEKMLEDSKEKAKKLEEKYMLQLQERKISGRFLSVYCQRPGEGIVEQARKEEATLIVTGTRGLNNMRRTVLGSVSDFVLHHANCPVVVCRKT